MFGLDSNEITNHRIISAELSLLCSKFIFQQYTIKDKIQI